MKESTLAKIFRIILGLGLIFFGLNGILQFVTPPALPSRGMEFFTALDSTGYMLPLMNIVFLLVALLLLTNKWTPFALVLLAPITLNIVLFHLFLDLASGTMGYIVALINIYLMIVHSDSYRPMFHKK
jgi:putative oxidoreductase